MPEKIIGFPPEKRVAMSGKESIERIKNIPAILTSLRKSKQFTQQEVAQVLNLSVETIIKIEN
ncbi:MAG: helix-turn-helix domain-containing protein [Candidatus Peribacteria bacterium]|jgi:DNA-binding transcriptional regulator YiaG|nr:helix-turn-helix domain-containing protein [Candidatus Peribacteria bacterium]